MSEYVFEVTDKFHGLDGDNNLYEIMEITKYVVAQGTAPAPGQHPDSIHLETADGEPVGRDAADPDKYHVLTAAGEKQVTRLPSKA